MKKALSLAVVLCLLVSLFSGLTINASAAFGTGTEGDPYLISSKADLELISQYPDASFKQTADITEAVTAPVLDSTKEFTGTYDGGGFSIPVTITTTSTYAGLFSKTNGATIKNLTVTGTISTAFDYCGAFVGQAVSTAFENCTNEANITLTTATRNYIGGIAGYVAEGTVTTFTKCVNKGNLAGSVSFQLSGGILGAAAAATSGPFVTFTSCANFGTISAVSGTKVGGIMGASTSAYASAGAKFTDCFNVGNISGNGWLGGILGSGRAGIALTNCYNTGDISASHATRGASALFNYERAGQTASLTNCYNTGSVKYKGTTSTATLVADEFVCTTTYTNCYYLTTDIATDTGTVDAATSITAAMLNAGESTAYIDYTYSDHPQLVSIPEPAPALGSKENPYLINTYDDLALIAQYPSAYFKQTADITTEVTAPINGAAAFTGTYDGNGKSIKVNIVTETGSTGLFSTVTDATIKNLTVTGTVTGTEAGVGGIAGAGLGTSTFDGCVNKAAVTGSNKNVGGIVGDCFSNSSISTVLTNCVNYGSVTGSDIYVGGIVGVAPNKADIQNCANYGNIIGNEEVGGIIGCSYSHIYKCFNAGNVTAVNLAGGIAGKHRASYDDGVVDCYNLGMITATDENGVASAFGGCQHSANLKFTNCYNAGEIVSSAGTQVLAQTGGTITYTNCYALTANAEADGLSGISGVTPVDKASLKSAALGSAYSVDASAAYPYPQLISNPQTTAWDFALLTVSVGENGTASFVGSKYVKDGISYPITFTPDETYELDKVFINTVEQPDSGEALSVPVSGDTTVSATFAEKQAVAPSASVVSAPFIPDTADSSYTFATINYGYGYEVTGYGILYSEDPDAITNAPETCETILEHVTPANGKGQFGIQLTGELPAGGYYTRAYVTYKNTATQETFTVYSDVIVEVK